MTAVLLQIDGYGKLNTVEGYSEKQWSWNKEKLEILDEEEMTKLIIQLTWT